MTKAAVWTKAQSLNLFIRGSSKQALSEENMAMPKLLVLSEDYIACQDLDYGVLYDLQTKLSLLGYVRLS